MKPYPDTNFFTRVYLELPESAAADLLMAEAWESRISPLPVTWLHRLETLNAMQLCVFMGRSAGQTRVTPEQAAAALAEFRADVETGAFFHAVPLPLERLEFQFEELALRHTAKHGFRSYDILHVASALILECDQFWSFDTKAAKLASLEGLETRFKGVS